MLERFLAVQEFVRMANGLVTQTQLVNQLHDYMMSKKRGMRRAVSHKNGRTEIGKQQNR